ncbi:efflux RND transporter periplasmic adaptor subunit [Aliikangiella maris]|uniref:Efflux RND transporter periplasmic adaptor subunit n=2 Tax=Aliikangiella maris TaxID=3162458 RepID=A0ABV3MLF3_9GAMM
MVIKKNFLIGVIVIIVCSAGVSLMFANKPKPPKKPVDDVAPLVDVFIPQKQSVTFEIKVHGVISPRTETTLVSEVSGVVQSVSNNFVVGGFFRKGEILLQIESTDYQVAVEQAKARLAGEQAKLAQEKARTEQAKKEWDLSGRSRDTAPLLALREPFLQEAQANVLSAQADLKKAEQKLARTVIRAPYDGMVKNKLADVGQFVATGTQLGTTFAIDYAEVRLPLTAQELAFINIPKIKQHMAQNSGTQASGSKVTLIAEYAGETRQWPARLVRMEGVVDERSRVHYAVAQIADPYSLLSDHSSQPPLSIGTFVSAIIEGRTEKDLYKIPREAFKDLTNILVSDKDERLYQRHLNVVRADANYVYVREGLQTGDQVIMTAIESPVQGMPLRVSISENDRTVIENKNSTAANNVVKEKNIVSQ